MKVPVCKKCRDKKGVFKIKGRNKKLAIGTPFGSSEVIKP